jgi:hypothetical protein
LFSVNQQGEVRAFLIKELEEFNKKQDEVTATVEIDEPPFNI